MSAKLTTPSIDSFSNPLEFNRYSTYLTEGICVTAWMGLGSGLMDDWWHDGSVDERSNNKLWAEAQVCHRPVPLQHLTFLVLPRDCQSPNIFTLMIFLFCSIMRTFYALLFLPHKTLSILEKNSLHVPSPHHRRVVLRHPVAVVMMVRENFLQKKIENRLVRPRI